jgi:hypothetical protein
MSYFHCCSTGVDTEWQLYVSDGTAYSDGNLEGMCADCDGDPKNDWTECHDNVILPMVDSSFDMISDSCAEGDHDGSNPKGGMKLS